MHGHGYPELAKKINDKILKIVDEMWERVRAFIRGETATDTTEAIRSPRWEKSNGKASWSEGQNRSRNMGHRRGEGRNMGTCASYARKEGFTPLTKTPREILAMDNVNFSPPPPMVGTLEKRNMNKFCDYHQDRGHNTNDCYHLKKQIKEALASGRLAHLVKDIRQGGQKSMGSTKGKEKVINMVRSQGYRKRPYERVEHWMDNAITFLLVPQYLLMNCPLVVEAMIEFFRVRRLHVDGGEVSYPMGVIFLEVTMGECKRTRTVIMEFTVVKIPSLYNALLGRTRMRNLGAVASTIHSMMKFPTSNGIATISTTRETLRECRQIEEAQDQSRHARVTDPTPMQTSSEVANPKVSLALVETHSRRPGKEPMQLDDMEGRRQPNKGRKPPKSGTEEKIVNVNIFTWTPADMTGIPPNTDDKEGRREDGFPYGRGSLLLHENAFWSQECRGNISEAGRLRLPPYCLQEQVRGKPRKVWRRKDLRIHIPSDGDKGIPLKKKKLSWTCHHQRPLSRCNTLNKCTNKKDFRWTEAAEAAFLEMKKLVSELPTLTTPKKGETLMMYLAAANEAVRAETNYAPMEKLALALVHAARRLRRYFQAYPIKFITDSPIKQVLNNSGASGRLAKWAVELGAYGITYVPRVAVKGQVLADTPTEINATPERLYTDGASNNEGFGAGLILIAPDDVEYSYALCLNFSNSNNDVEYEALLAGLRITKEMQVKDIHAFVDSKLVASQMEGLYEAKGERIIKYQEKVLELVGAFNRF
ncbi:reverse transcriptase domain-containing protein [Tanacetum coccineum]|uniref:Reverse transcriptase domain-containing protein n=1 Tax=Tanacetum coccineum TaxID=301880 RepID=A0ABQ4WI10_9ASTR